MLEMANAFTPPVQTPPNRKLKQKTDIEQNNNDFVTITIWIISC